MIWLKMVTLYSKNFQLRGIINHNQELVDHYPSSVERQTRFGYLHDSPRRFNTMEFAFDMLDFSITYHSATDAMTANRGLINLHKFDLDNEEWVTAEKLRGTLKVCFSYRRSINNC